MFSLQSLKGAVTPTSPRLSTGIESLDASLGGGLPLGKIVEISGVPGSGRSTLALSIGLRCLALGQAVAWIEPRPSFWPLQALEAGIPLGRLLVLRVRPAEQLRAAQLLLASPGAVQVAIIDSAGGFGERAGKRRDPSSELLPFQLARLRRMAERSSALLIFLTERDPDAASLGSLIDIRLHLRLPQGDVSLPAGGFVPGREPMGGAVGGGRSSCSLRASIFDRCLEVAVLRHKQGPSQGRFSEALHGPDRLRLRSTL